MQPRIINVKNLSAKDEKAWRDLSGRALEPNPFYEPDCLIPAAIHQTFGDQIDLVVAEVERSLLRLPAGRRVSRWRGLPYKIVTSQVRRMTYLGTPLVDEEHGLEAVTAVLSASWTNVARVVESPRPPRSDRGTGLVPVPCSGIGFETASRGIRVLRTRHARTARPAWLPAGPQS